MIAQSLVRRAHQGEWNQSTQLPLIGRLDSGEHLPDIGVVPLHEVLDSTGGLCRQRGEASMAVDWSFSKRHLLAVNLPGSPGCGYYLLGNLLVQWRGWRNGHLVVRLPRLRFHPGYREQPGLSRRAR